MSKGKHINNFKEGDLITRVEPVYFGIKTNLKEDKSYIEEPFIYKGQSMNYIILDRTKQKLDIFEAKEITLDSCIYENGWDYYSLEKRDKEGNAINDLILEFNKNFFN